MLHIGLGSFHRAHQAVYIHKLRELGDMRWHIASGNIRPGMHKTIESLCADEGRFTLELVSPDTQRQYHRIESICRIFPYKEQVHELIACGADSATCIISFTVTEAGYYLDAHDNVDWENFSDIRQGLQASDNNYSGDILYSVLTAILRKRMHTDAGPVTLLCCDNLRHNGYRSRRGLLQFVQKLGDQDLLQWIQIHTTNPNTMVDRITPRPTSDVIARVQEKCGRYDAAALMAEDFTQWVIEDTFANVRPCWEKVGVEMVVDVDPYEEAKIRILNATHACIAWAGALVGYTYIHQSIADKNIFTIAYNYVTYAVIPVLEFGNSVYPLDLASYRDSVFARFTNSAIGDTNARVSMDAFSKIPSQIVPTIRQCLEQKRSIYDVAMLPALFCTFLQSWYRHELPFTYEDQAMNPCVVQSICNATDPIYAFAGEVTLWGDLACDKRIVRALTIASKRIEFFIQEQSSCQTNV